MKSFISTNIIIYSFCFVLFSCQKRTPDAPPIERDALIEMIVDALIIEPALRELPRMRQDSIRSLAYEQVFKAKGYTLAEFTSSMQWLQRDPLRLVDIYKEVMVELDRKDALISSKVTKEKENKNE